MTSANKKLYSVAIKLESAFHCNFTCFPETGEKFKHVGPEAVFENYDISRQLSLIRLAMMTRIDDDLSPGNVTAVQGDTAMLVCTVVNIGDKSVGPLHSGQYVRDKSVRVCTVVNIGGKSVRVVTMSGDNSVGLHSSKYMRTNRQVCHVVTIGDKSVRVCTVVNIGRQIGRSAQ